MSFEEVLAQTRDRMSPLLRSFYPGAEWPFHEVIGFIDEVGSATIASVGPSGHPHAAVVIAKFVAGAVHFTVTPGTILERNLTREPRIGFSVAEGHRSVMGQGRATRAATLHGHGTGDPEWAQIAPSGWSGSIWRIEPTSVFAG